MKCVLDVLIFPLNIRTFYYYLLLCIR